MAKNKYTKIGAVLQGEHGPFLVLGNTKSKDEKYNYEVQVMVKKADGTKIIVKNPLLSLFDPRNFKQEDGKPERNVPEKLLFEVSVAEPKEND